MDYVVCCKDEDVQPPRIHADNITLNNEIMHE